MDVGIITAVAMLLVWGVWALAFDGPGWIHLLLTFGVTLLIYRVVVRGTQTANGRDRERPDG
ncbi:MAG: hypothetical protein ABR499_09290 [Gemmatimonadaceae bacterium]